MLDRRVYGLLQSRMTLELNQLGATSGWLDGVDSEILKKRAANAGLGNVNCTPFDAQHLNPEMIDKA